MQSRHCAVEINVVTVMTSKRFLRCINRLVSCFYSEWVHGLNVALWCTFMCTTCSNDHISASRHLICFSWRLIHCLWYIFVLHTFPLSSHLCASTSLAHISSRWLSPHIPITRSFCRLSRLLCSSPLLSRFPPRSLLHSLQLHRLRSSHILSLLSYLAVCVPFLLPSFNLLKKKKKSPVSHWWLHVVTFFLLSKWSVFISSATPTPPLRSASSQTRVSQNWFTKKKYMFRDLLCWS